MKKICAFILAMIAAECVCAGAANASLGAAVSDKGLFVKNVGQLCSDVSFYMPGRSGTIFVTDAGSIVYSFVEPLTASSGSTVRPRSFPRNILRNGWAITEIPVGGHPDIRGGRRDGLRLRVQSGVEPTSRIPVYNSITLASLWPGVHVDLRVREGGLEKVLFIEPQASIAAVKFRIEGCQKINLGADGSLSFRAGAYDVFLSKPVAWQVKDRRRTAVPVNYVTSGNEYSFALGEFDPCLPLVIDPLVQASYIGGTGTDYAYALAVDQATGDVYLSGYTEAVDFPTGPLGEPFTSSPPDVFLARTDSQLSELHEIVYLQGDGAEAAWALAIDEPSNTLYLAGETTSSDFPGTSGGASPLPGGNWDGFVARFSLNPLTLQQSTYFGGSDEDYVKDLTLNPVTGDVYVTGFTISPDLPGTTAGAQPGSAGGWDAFVARFADSLTELRQATYLGGSGDDSGYDIAADTLSGDIYVTGLTSSSDFPEVAGGAQETIGSSYDAYVSKLDASLSVVQQSTYFGGEGIDEGFMLAFDEAAPALYFAGETASTSLPATSNAAQPGHGGGFWDAFICRCDVSLRQFNRTTYFGGLGNEACWGLAVPKNRKQIFATGYTSSRRLSWAQGGAQSAYGGGIADAFVVSLNRDLTGIRQATYLGGSGNEYNYGISYREASGLVYTGGDTSSINYPGTTGGFQPVFGGGSYDGAVAVLTSDLASRVSLSRRYRLQNLK